MAAIFEFVLQGCCERKSVNVLNVSEFEVKENNFIKKRHFFLIFNQLKKKNCFIIYNLNLKKADLIVNLKCCN